MKHIISIVSGVIFVLGLHFHAYGADRCKVAIVDFQKIQQDSAAAQKVVEEFQKKLEPQLKRLKEEQAELVRLDEELRNQSMMLSLDAKEDRRNELEKKKRHYKYLENEFLQAQKQARFDVIRIMGNDVKEIVEKIGKKDEYTMILEKNASAFLYYDEKLDITDQVIKAYDNMKP